MVTYAQNEKYIIQNYQSKDGLPQNSVNSIQFDKQGYCWLTTESGIVKFDNKNFVTYNSEQLKHLSSNRMRFISPTKSGNLFFTNDKNELFQINVNSGLRSSYPVFYPDQNRIITNKGFSIVKNANYDSIIIKEKLKDGRPFLHSVITTSKGELYFHNQNRLYYLYGNFKSLTILKETGFSHESPLNDSFFMQIYPKNNVKIWKNGRLINENISLNGDIVRNKSYLSGDFRIFWNPDYVFIYANKEVYQISYKNNNLQTTKVLSDINIPNINTITYLKSEKKYFIGSATNGLYIYRPILFNYYTSKLPNNRENYNTIIKDDKDNIYANNNIFSPNGNSKRVNLINQDYLHAFWDKDNLIYDGNFKLNEYNPKNKKVKIIQNISGRLKASILYNGRYYLLESHRLFIIKNDSLVSIFNFPDSIDANGIIKYATDTALLYTSSGIYKLNLRNGIRSDHGLSNIPIRSIYLENRTRWWIASDGLGAILYEQGKYIRFPKKLGNPFNSIHSFILDKKNNFWIPTNSGLYTINRTKLLDALTQNGIFYFYRYDFKDGLKTDEFNGSGNPSFLWINNTLVLPSINGLVKFNTIEASPILPKHGIHIDNIYVDDTLSQQEGNEISVRSKFYSLKINLSSPYFGNEEDNPLEYNLNGITNSWEKVDPSGTIHINNLPYGEYILKIRKAINDTQLQNEFDIKINVLPFYYETIVFKTLCILGIITTLIFYIRFRLYTLKKRNQKIAILVEEQTAELRKNLFTLETTKEKLYNSNIVKERTIAIVLHDLRSPIRFISIISKDLLKKISSSQNIPSNITSSMDALNKSLLSLEEYSIQFFSWAKSQQDHFHVQYSKFWLLELFVEIETLYKEILSVQNNKLEIEDNSINIYSDRFILSIIIRNLIDNANKNMSHGKVKLSAITKRNEIVITIADTGPGLSTFSKRKYQHKSLNINSKEGMGQSIIMDLLPKIQAKIEIISSNENGTQFNIIINHHQQYDIF